MSHDPVAPGDGADDLLGRWLAHHDNTVVDDDATAARPHRTPIAARPSEAAAQRLSRPSAAAALADLRTGPPVDGQGGLGGVTPPSTFGVRRGVPGSASSGPTGALGHRIATSEMAELDRPSPVGFEPVILRSVRKKTEPKEEPAKKDRGGRLSRLRSRVAGPVEAAVPQEESPAVALRAEPVAVVPPPVFKEAAPTPASPPRKVVPVEDVIALATTASLPVAAPQLAPEPEPGPQPEPRPEPQPEVEPVVPDPEPAPVVPEPEPQPEVEPVLPGPDPEPTPVVPDPGPVPEPQAEVQDEVEPVLPEPELAGADVKVPAKRRLVARARRPEPEPEPEERKRRPLVARSANPPTTGTGTSTGTGTGSAARGLLAAARAATPAATLASQAPPAPKHVEPVPMLPVEPAVEAPVASAPSMQMPTVYEFEPRRFVRRFLSLMLIVGLVASGRLGYAAYLSRDTVEMGIAGIVTVATLVIWAIRAGATVTRLTVKSGQLEIARQGGRMVFDLASSYTAIEVVGKPGSKKWKVLFLRRGMAPVTVDSTMVDGREFMRVLGFFRPEVA